MANKKIALNTKSRKLVMHETMTGYAFMLPFLIFFVMFVLYPMFMCVYTSFFDATMGRDDIFVGFNNYKTLFQDDVFWIALRNTLVIVLVSVPVTCAFSLWVASVISKMRVGATPLSAASSICLWSPAPWLLPWSGSGCSIITAACSTTLAPAPAC